jgi:hypothetical protein
MERNTILRSISDINILLAQPKINVMFLKPSYCFYAEEVREILSQAFREEKSS